MTDSIEQKALALVNAVEVDRVLFQRTQSINREYTGDEALCRAIEQHEAFRQEVSDAVEKLSAAMLSPYVAELLGRFIIAKPDPLVEVIATALLEGSPFDEDGSHNYMAEAKAVAAAIEKRGGKIVWGEG